MCGLVIRFRFGVGLGEGLGRRGSPESWEEGRDYPKQDLLTLINWDVF